MESIGDRLRSLRGETSQKAAALATGIRQQVWNRYEKNQTAPASDSIIKICNTFRCSSDWLLGLSDSMERGVPSVTAPQNSGAIAVGAGARATAGNDNKRTTTSCATCKYKQFAEVFKAIQTPD